MSRFCVMLLLALSWQLANVVTAAEEAESAKRMTAKAMALLRENCLSCHNAGKQKGGLALHKRDLALKGGDSGPSLISGDSLKSPLVQSLAPDADPHMPPKKQLAEVQIATLRTWVDAGAPWDEGILNAQQTTALPAEFGPLPSLYQPVLAVALSTDGKLLAAGRGSKVFLHDASKNEHPLIKTLAGPRDAVQSLAISPDGSVVAAGEFQKVWLWETKTWTEKLALTNRLEGRITALAFSPDGKFLALAHGETAKAGLIQIVDVASGAVSQEWIAHSDTIYALSISRDGKSLATASADKLIRLWGLPDGKEKGQLEGHTGHVLAVAFNEDGSRVVSGGSDKELKIWDTKTKEKVIASGAHDFPITGLAWTAQGKTAVSSCEDGAVRTFTEFKVHSGEQSSRGTQDRKVSSTSVPLLCVAADAEAKFFYAGTAKGTIFVWESGGKQRAELKAPEPVATAGISAEKEK